jgi:hypothetical protein
MSPMPMTSSSSPCKPIEDGSAGFREDMHDRVSRDCMNKSQYSRVREYQDCKESLVIEALMRNENSMETFDD